jgi:flagellar assembly factor FliW
MTAVLREQMAEQTVHTRLFGAIAVPIDRIIDFPDGVPGFPAARQFALLPAVAPMLSWLQSLDAPALAFLLVTWETVAEPLLDIGGACYAIVTLPGAEPLASVNLQAPVVIDRIARLGRQIIRTDANPGTALPFDLEPLIHPV